MAVFRPRIVNSKTRKIKFSKYFYCSYDLSDGTRKQKSTGKTTLAEAKEWENEFVEKLKSLKTEKAVVEEYRNVLRGGEAIKLEETFLRFKDKVQKKASTKYLHRLESMWNDFHAYLLCNLTESFEYLRLNYCLFEAGKTKTHCVG